MEVVPSLQGVAWKPTIGHGRASVTGDRLAQLSLSTAGDEHTGTLFSEALCSSKADADAPTGHKHNRAFQLATHVLLSDQMSLART
jgi:hypothetical protein